MGNTERVMDVMKKWKGEDKKHVFFQLCRQNDIEEGRQIEEHKGPIFGRLKYMHLHVHLCILCIYNYSTSKY